MFCYNCGAENPNDANYCIKCGTMIRQVVMPPPPPSAALEDDVAMRLLLPVGRSGWAIAAGYLGLFSICLVPAPIAIVVSIVALRDLKMNPKKFGKGRAIFGLVMGILGTAVLPFAILGLRNI